jgi:hypothetical protein
MRYEDGHEEIIDETVQWNPMKGFPDETGEAFRHWTYGGIVGVKAVIAGHYTVSLDYSEDIKRILRVGSLRTYGFRLNVGYRF